MKKKDISLNISKHFATIFDNKGTFETILGFGVFILTQQA